MRLLPCFATAAVVVASANAIAPDGQNLAFSGSHGEDPRLDPAIQEVEAAIRTNPPTAPPRRPGTNPSRS